MSHSQSHSAGSHGHVGSDEMNLGKIIFVGVMSLVIFGLGIVWARYLMVREKAEVRRSGPAKVATEIGKPEIGIVDQVLFSADNRLEVWRAEHDKRLESYGWVDKARGIAHIPIEEAMARVVASPPDIPGQGVPPVAAPPAPPEFNAGEAAKPAAPPAPGPGKGKKR